MGSEAAYSWARLVARFPLKTLKLLAVWSISKGGDSTSPDLLKKGNGIPLTAVTAFMVIILRPSPIFTCHVNVCWDCLLTSPCWVSSGAPIVGFDLRCTQWSWTGRGLGTYISSLRLSCPFWWRDLMLTQSQKRNNLASRCRLFKWFKYHYRHVESKIQNPKSNYSKLWCEKTRIKKN